MGSQYQERQAALEHLVQAGHDLSRFETDPSFHKAGEKIPQHAEDSTPQAHMPGKAKERPKDQAGQDPTHDPAQSFVRTE